VSEIVLHLGGNWRRIQRTIQQAKWCPNSMVVISSEGNQGLIREALAQARIRPERVVFDAAAYDTVGNFTDTYPLIRRLNGRTVYVVTSDWHMRRAMAIARVCYFGRGIRAVACPWPDNPSKKDLGGACWDLWRTLQWRLTGKPPLRGYHWK
jgi:uncharacterized SAM-binding protein YcdF (DUF218 family)